MAAFETKNAEPVTNPNLRQRGGIKMDAWDAAKQVSKNVFQEVFEAAQSVTLCLDCQQPLRTYEQSGRLHGECRNKHCRRVWITREIAELQTLSNADLDAMGFGDWSEKETS